MTGVVHIIAKHVTRHSNLPKYSCLSLGELNLYVIDDDNADIESV